MVAHAKGRLRLRRPPPRGASRIPAHADRRGTAHRPRRRRQPRRPREARRLPRRVRSHRRAPVDLGPRRRLQRRGRRRDPGVGVVAARAARRRLRPRESAAGCHGLRRSGGRCPAHRPGAPAVVGRTARALSRRAARRVPGHLGRSDRPAGDPVRRDRRHGRRRPAPGHLRLARRQCRKPRRLPRRLRPDGRMSAIRPLDELAQQRARARRRQRRAGAPRLAGGRRGRRAPLAAGGSRRGGRDRVRERPRRRGRPRRVVVRRRPRGSCRRGTRHHGSGAVPQQEAHGALRRCARAARHPSSHPRAGRPADHSRGRRRRVGPAGHQRPRGGVRADPPAVRPPLGRRSRGSPRSRAARPPPGHPRRRPAAARARDRGPSALDPGADRASLVDALDFVTRQTDGHGWLTDITPEGRARLREAGRCSPR